MLIMSKTTIRHIAPRRLVSRLRGAGVTQVAIAQRLGVSQSFVSRVIAGRAVVRPSEKSEAVWREIRRALAAHERRSA